MSASDKKKLRKEQQSAAMTEKQLSEQKQQKKTKAYTITFIVAMVLVLAIVAGSALSAPVKTLLMKNTTALTVNDHELDAVEFHYFYMDAISEFYSNFSSSGGSYADLYIQMYTGLNPAKPLDSQVYDKESGDTWADYFADSAIESAKWSYTMYDAAMADPDFKLTEDQQKSLDSVESNFALLASYYGYSSANAYLRSMYGSNANMNTYLDYYKVSSIATIYASNYIDSLDFGDEDFRKHETDKMKEYNSYTYAYVYLDASKYLTGGTTTKDENGKETTTYSDDEKKAAVALALKDAQTLTAADINDLEKLDAAIGKLTTKNLPKTATKNSNVLYSKLPTVEDMAEWITAEERIAGDTTFIPSVTHTHAEGEEHKDDEDESKYETVNGYYVVMYLDATDNTMNIGTVRHLLIQFRNDDGKGYSDGIKTFTDAQKLAAKNEAEKLLKQYQDGKKTEESFTELVKKHSQDTGSKTSGGLISDITPDSGYVESFTEWATADHEKGDVEIIESVYGYHIMYYVEAEELNYRDTLINNDLIDEAYDKWQDALLEKTTATEGDMKHLDSDFVMSK